MIRRIAGEGKSEADLNHEAQKRHQNISTGIEQLARNVVDAGVMVHRALGPGLLESAYEHCLAYELQIRAIASVRQVALPVVYKGTQIDAGYRLDLVVENCIIVEIKAVGAILPVHHAQLLTYLKLSG